MTLLESLVRRGWSVQISTAENAPHPPTVCVHVERMFLGRTKWAIGRSPHFDAAVAEADAGARDAERVMSQDEGS